MRFRALVADIHPADHRAIGGSENPTLDERVCHDRAADEPGRNADAKAAPTPTAMMVAPVVGRRGSGSERNRAESDRCSENESHFTEHEISPCCVGCLF